MNGCPWETVHFCGGKWIAPIGWGARDPPTSWQMLYHLKFELSGPDAFYLMFLFNTDWWWMDVVTKMPHFRWFQSRTLRFMLNALPFEMDSTYPCARQNKESRTQCHNWPWNQLFVIQFCISYRYLIIRSQVCTLFGNRVILLWVKVRTNCIIRTGITAKIEFIRFGLWALSH